MKKLIFTFIILFCPALFANSVEFITGGLAYHLFSNPSVSPQFSNKISSDGSLIYTPLIGFGYTYNNDSFYRSYRFFLGHNSINEQMGGGLYAFGINNKHFELGFITGGYYQNGSQFNKIGVSIGDFIPLIGGELNYKYFLNNSKFLKISTEVNVIMINETLSIGENF